MNIEVELKARTADPEVCRKKLSALGGEGTAFSKDDVYWFPAPVSGTALPHIPPSGLRVRREQSGGDHERCLVTWKSKETREGVEVNGEHEFEVNDGAAFEELLLRLGMERRTWKHKEGRKWAIDGITAELCEVRGWAPKKRAPPEKAPPPAAVDGNTASGNVAAGGSKNLGWFLELEIILGAQPAQTEVENARRRLFEMLEQADLSKEALENRYYSELLRIS